MGTNPNSWDSDGDWYYDFDEYGLSDPLNILSTPATGDTDGDYISDILEAIIGTDPNNIDTDGDGVDDGSEEDLGYDPLDSSSPSLSFPPPPIYIFPASSGQVNVAFYPGSSGTKQATLTLYFNLLSAQRTVTINLAGRAETKPVPGVDFFRWTMEPETSLAGEFFITYYGIDPTNPVWDFGDGATAEVMHPTHFYASAGEYEVSLTVTNAINGTRFSRERIVRFPENLALPPSTEVIYTPSPPPPRRITSAMAVSGAKAGGIFNKRRGKIAIGEAAESELAVSTASWGSIKAAVSEDDNK